MRGRPKEYEREPGGLDEGTLPRRGPVDDPTGEWRDFSGWDLSPWT